jgi:lysophospholipase L1-like esterase
MKKKICFIYLYFRLSMLNKVIKLSLYVLYLFLIVAIGLEVFLRIYSPIKVRVSSGKVVLPKNQKYSLPNKNFSKLSKNAIHTKNSWGFRGDEWNPETTKSKLLFVGGSTTECFHADDNKTWVAQYAKYLGTNFLVNNAGLNGHSTFGHISLLKEYIKVIKPDYVFFLVGINDVAVTENGQNIFDEKITGKGFDRTLIKIEEKSKLVNLLHSFYRSYQAKKMDLADNIEWKLEERSSDHQFSEDEKLALFSKHKTAQDAYASRLVTLIEIAQSVNAKPVFITQPLLFGKAIDSSTGIDLGKFAIYGITGEEYEMKLSLYNETMKKVATEKSLPVVDLAAFLSNDSRYYVDDMHFSDAGAKKISEILKEKVFFDSDKQLHIKE